MPLAGSICAPAGLRSRSLFLAPSTDQASQLRSTRPYNGPMAVPADSGSVLRPPFHLAIVALCLAAVLTGLFRPDSLRPAVWTALAGLGFVEAMPLDGLDGADLPAMDPRIARVVDPRPAALAGLLSARARGAVVETFQYDVRPDETVFDVAARFGVSLAALLWNNGLESPEHVRPGQRLTFLPMSGVVHRVQDGETAAGLAERYGVQRRALVAANGLEEDEVLVAGRVLVVPGGAVPTPRTAPTATAEPTLWTPFPLATAIVEQLPSAEPSPAIPTERVEDLPRPRNAAGWQRDFILSLAVDARESQRLTGVPASVTLAQAILESDWGRSRLAREAKNLFGIKAHTRPGTAGVYRIGTWEVEGGANVIRNEPFRAYGTFVESIADHGRWFHQQPRYAGALAVRDDPRAFAYAIAAAGYATDPVYATKLVTLMERHGLEVYDVESQ
jgi:LysM repeat protein